MGQMSSSVPPAVLQSLQMYGENRAQSANLAQRGAMHRDEMELQAAQFEAKVRMEQQGLEFQKQQAEQQNEMAKAQLGEQEKDRALREQMAQRAEQFNLKMKKTDIEMAMAQLKALGATDAADMEVDAAAAEQEQLENEKSQAAVILGEISNARPETHMTILQQIEEASLIESQTLDTLKAQLEADVDDVDTSLYASGETRLDRDAAWKAEAESAGAMSSVNLQKVANALVPGAIFDPAQATEDKRLPVVMKAVEKRMTAMAERAAGAIADPGNEKVVAGALTQVANAAATLSGVARNTTLAGRFKEGELDGLRQVLVQGIEQAKKAGASEQEIAIFIKAVSQKQADIFGGPAVKGMEKAASGGSPDKATMALNEDAKAFMKGMWDAVKAAGIRDPDALFKERQNVNKNVARVLAYEQDDMTAMSALADLSPTVRAKVGENARSLREVGKLGQYDEYKGKVEKAGAGVLGAAAKGRKAKRKGEAAAAQAQYGSLADVAKGLN